MRNAAVHFLLQDDEDTPHAILAASAEQITAEIDSAMPAKTSPTSLGAAALEPGKAEELAGPELVHFLREHSLEHLGDMEGVGWRAKKL